MPISKALDTQLHLRLCWLNIFDIKYHDRLIIGLQNIIMSLNFTLEVNGLKVCKSWNTPEADTCLSSLAYFSQSA